MDKATLRARTIAAVRALPPAQRALEEELVTAALQADARWRDARRVLLYRSLGWEFSTVGLANAAWRAGKEVLFPRQAGPGLEFVAAASWGAFGAGVRGIPEPAGPAVDLDGAGHLMVVPGVAWKLDGGRLGRGAGCYDRFLAEHRSRVLSVGVGFDAQLVDDLPHDAHDQRVDEVWTCRSRKLVG